MADDSKKKSNMFLHAYHFVKDHWGEMYVMYDLVRGFATKEKPDDDAHAVVKLVHGGRSSIEDEIAYEAIEISGLTDEERALMGDFRQWSKGRFGETILGKQSFKSFDNNFRQMIMRMRIPESVATDTETIPNAKGPPTVKKTERRIPVDNTPAIKFLKRLTYAIKCGRDDTRGSRQAKLEAGNIRGCEYLREYNMPTPNASEVVKVADELIGKLPAAAATTGSIVKDVASAGLEIAGTTYKKAGSWIDQEHTKLEERNNREGRLAGFRRWYRSLR